jgi:hypothetical protein
MPSSTRREWPICSQQAHSCQEPAPHVSRSSFAGTKFYSSITRLLLDQLLEGFRAVIIDFGEINAINAVMRCISCGCQSRCERLLFSALTQPLELSAGFCLVELILINAIEPTPKASLMPLREAKNLRTDIGEPVLLSLPRLRRFVLTSPSVADVLEYRSDQLQRLLTNCRTWNIMEKLVTEK